MSLPDLTTLANVKSWLTITGTADDGEISRLITVASAWVRSVCNRDFSLLSYADTVDGKGAFRIATPQYPIQSVSSVIIDGTSIAPADALSSGYVFDQNWIMLRGYRFNRGFQNIQLGYQAGFAVIPADLEQAVIEIVGLRRSQAKNNGLSSKGMAGETTSFIVKDLLPATQTILQKYTRVWL